jgi:sugar phosphate isomerase/epimerase
LENALRMIAELEFSKLDVCLHERGRLRPSLVARDVHQASQQIRLGPGLAPAALTVDLEPASEADYHKEFHAMCRLARISSIPLITIAAASAGSGIDTEVQRLGRLTRTAAGEGIVLCVATHMGTVTETPDAAVELCQRVPGLGLTLDPSHYIAGPHQGKSYDQVFPYVRHVQLRDTGRGPNQFQVRVGQGEIEYGRIVSMLSRYHYDRLLTVDIHDIPDTSFVMQSEVRKLKLLLESLI